MSKTLGIEQAINISKWDKESTWVKLVMELDRSIKPWPNAYYNKFVKNSRQGSLDATRI